MCNECLRACNVRLLNPWRGRCNRTSPSTWAEHGACTIAGTEPQPIDSPSEPPFNPHAAVELIGTVNEADIFIGDTHVTTLIDTGAQVSRITRGFFEQHRYGIHPVNPMLHLEGTGGFSISYLGYIQAIIKIPPKKTTRNVFLCWS